MRNYHLAALIRKLLVNRMGKHKIEVLTVKIQLKVKFPQADITKDSSNKDSSTGVSENFQNSYMTENSGQLLLTLCMKNH